MSATTYTGPTDFDVDANIAAFQSVFDTAPSISVLHYQSLVSIDASPICSGSSSICSGTSICTLSLSYTGAPAFIANSALFTISLHDSVAEITAALRLLSIG